MATQLALILVLFSAGWWLRWRGIMSAAHVALLLRIVINAAIPLLIVGALLRAPLTRELMLQPVAIILIMAGGMLISGIVARIWKIPRPRAGVFVVTAGCLNMAFSYPLVAAMRGTAALTQWIIIDIGVSIMTWTFIAFVAASYGGHPGEWRRALRRVLGLAPFWAIAFGLALRFSGLDVPALWPALMQGTGRWLMLLVIPAMGGLAVALRRLDAQIFVALMLRVALGMVLAVVVVKLLGIAPENRVLVIFGGAAPVGFSAVALSQREALDVEFAGAVTAISILLALVYLPLLLMLL